MHFTKITLILILLLIGLNNTANSQNGDAHHDEFSKIDRDYSDGVASEAFITKSFFENYELSGGDTTKTRMRVWSPKENANSDYNQIFDIRWKFDTNLEAVDFYNKFMDINSENSEELKKTNIEIKDADLLKVFEDVNSEEMMKAFGFASKNYCFLMVVNNYVIKIYISAADTIKVTNAKIFAEEAAARTHMASL